MVLSRVFSGDHGDDLVVLGDSKLSSHVVSVTRSCRGDIRPAPRHDSDALRRETETLATCRPHRLGNSVDSDAVAPQQRPVHAMGGLEPKSAFPGQAGLVDQVFGGREAHQMHGPMGNQQRSERRSEQRAMNDARCELLRRTTHQQQIGGMNGL